VKLGVHLGVEDNLCDAVTVAQVDEEQAAVVADRGDPAAEDDFGADVGAREFAAGVGSSNADHVSS